jgi:hypothetical protein
MILKQSLARSKNRQALFTLALTDMHYVRGPTNLLTFLRVQYLVLAGFARGGQVEDENDMLLRILGDM